MPNTLDENDTIVDDLDFSDLDLGDTSEDSFDEPAATKPVKKGPDVVTLGIYGLIGVAVIGVVVWQMGLLGGSQNAMPAATEQAEGANPADPSQQPSDPFNVMGTPPEAPEMQMDTAMGAGTPPADPAAVPPIQMDTAQGGTVDAIPPATTTVMPAQDSAIPMPSDPAAVTPAVTDTVPMPEPVPAGVTATPAATSVSVTTETMIPAQPTAVPAAPEVPSMPAATGVVPAAEATPPAAQNVANDVTLSPNDMTAIMTRLEAIEKRLDEQKTTATSSPAISNELQDLKDKISRLESGSVSNNNETMAEPEKAAAPVKKKKSTKKKSAAKKKPISNSAADAPYNGGAVLSGNTASAVSNDYTLRSAQPGSAWVSNQDGTLREVRVGDSLPGVGEVKAIEQSGNAWSVVGTNGQINQ